MAKKSINSSSLPQMSFTTLKNPNLLILLINSYMFFYETQYVLILSFFAYISGIRLLQSHIQTPQLVTKTQESIFYLSNILIWTCDLKKIYIQKKFQMLFMLIIVLVCFIKAIRFFGKIVLKSISLMKPTFKEMYIVSQITTLRLILIQFIEISLDTEHWSLQVLGRCIVSNHIFQLLKLGHLRHIISAFNLFIGMICFVFPRYSLLWIAIRIVRFLLQLRNDYYNIWDYDRLRAGARQYSMTFYNIALLVCSISRVYWIYGYLYETSLYCSIGVLIYRKILWNLIRLDKNNYKDGIPNQKILTPKGKQY